MDSTKFDTITRLLSSGRSRRGVVPLLGGVTLGGLLSPLLVASDAGAKKHPGKQRHGSGHGKGGHDKTRHDRKDRSKPEGDGRAGAENCIQTGRRCPAGKRGGKGSGQRRLSCERCCQRTFEIGADGKKRCACKNDGAACESAAHCCSAACQAGVCVAASASSVPPPPPSPTCAESCSGCCDGEECLAGSSSEACGDDGASCAVCANPTPLCRNRSCSTCTSHTQCGSTSLCEGGACLPCDVCPNGCIFSLVQDAIAVADAGATIRICPGFYNGDVTIGKSLTLIGTGDGSGAGSTILRGSGGASVVHTTDGAVQLLSMRITGGGGGVGGGIFNEGATLALDGCTITGNTAGTNGGGIANAPEGTVELFVSTVSGNSAAQGGGIANAGQVSLFGSDIAGNTGSDLGGGIYNFAGASVELIDFADVASRVTGNDADPTNADAGGGIYNEVGGTVTLPNAQDVTGNDPDDCGGDTAGYSGPGAICTTT